MKKLTEARRQGPSGDAAVREVVATQRALKAIWFQQVSLLPTVHRA